MKVEKKPLAEITTRAIEVLSRELGLADTLRFMNQFSKGHGDYTSDREILFKEVTLDQIIAEIDRTRGSRSGDSAPMEGR